MPLTSEQLKGLKAYKAMTSEGRLVVMPFVLSGEFVRFDARLYKRGVGGHVSPTPEALESVGMPPDWGGKAQALAGALTALYPPLPAPELIEAHAKVLGLPAPTVYPESAPAPGGVEVEVSTPESTPES